MIQNETIKECLLEIVSRQNPENEDDAISTLYRVDSEEVIEQIISNINDEEALQLGFVENKMGEIMTPTEVFFDFYEKALKEAEEEIRDDYDTASFYRSLAVESRMW